jgi:hypothetical protein
METMTRAFMEATSILSWTKTHSSIWERTSLWKTPMTRAKRNHTSSITGVIAPVVHPILQSYPSPSSSIPKPTKMHLAHSLTVTVSLPISLL